MYHSEETSFGGGVLDIWLLKAYGFSICIDVYYFVSWKLGIYVLCIFFGEDQASRLVINLKLF